MTFISAPVIWALRSAVFDGRGICASFQVGQPTKKHLASILSSLATMLRDKHHFGQPGRGVVQ